MFAMFTEMRSRPRHGRLGAPRKAVLPLAAALLALAAAVPLQAGVVVDLETRNLLEPAAQVETNRLLVQDGSVRFDHLIAGELQASVIYTERVGLVVDHLRQSYQLIDDAALKALTERLQVASDALDAKLATLPKEHHQLFVDSLRTRSAEATPTELEATAEQADKEGRPSRKYRYTRGGQLVREVWATPWEKLGPAGPALKKAMGDLAELYALMNLPYNAVKSAALANQPIFPAAPHLFQELARIDGFPVAYTLFAADGQGAGETRMVKIDERALDKAEFRPPAGFQRVTLQ